MYRIKVLKDKFVRIIYLLSLKLYIFVCFLRDIKKEMLFVVFIKIKLILR